MKYLEKFTLHDRTCCSQPVEVTYDAVRGLYKFDYSTGYTSYFYEDAIEQLLEDYYDISKESEPFFADKFSFYHEGTTAKYDMTKLPNSDLWECAVSGEKAQGALYNAAQIALNFDNGYWEECSYSEPEERDLVFPFKFWTPSEDYHYTAIGLNERGRVQIVWDGGSGDEGTDYSVDNTKKFIKRGTWRVTSVGEPAVEKEYTATLKFEAEGLDSIPANAQSLAVKYEELAIALESVKVLMQELGIPLAGAVDCAHAFCFED